MVYVNVVVVQFRPAGSRYSLKHDTVLTANRNFESNILKNVEVCGFENSHFATRIIDID